MGKKEGKMSYKKGKGMYVYNIPLCYMVRPIVLLGCFILSVSNVLAVEYPLVLKDLSHWEEEQRSVRRVVIPIVSESRLFEGVRSSSFSRVICITPEARLLRKDLSNDAEDRPTALVSLDENISRNGTLGDLSFGILSDQQAVFSRNRHKVMTY